MPTDRGDHSGRGHQVLEDVEEYLYDGASAEIWVIPASRADCYIVEQAFTIRKNTRTIVEEQKIPTGNISITPSR